MLLEEEEEEDHLHHRAAGDQSRAAVSVSVLCLHVSPWSWTNVVSRPTSAVVGAFIVKTTVI